MTRNLAKAIFWVGTLSSAVIFLLLTWNTQSQVAVLTHADKLSPEVVAGKRVFQKYNCNDCHTILGFGGYYAPDLTRVYRRRGAAYIKKVISQPEVVFVNSFRKMPHQNVSPQEINQLVAFFEWVSNIENNDWPPQDAKKRRSSEYSRLLGGTNVSPGAALFKTNGCFGCHKLNGVGGDVGPELSAIGLKLDIAAIKRQISNPQAVNPNNEMPAFSDLSEQDIQTLAEFLAAQKGGK